MDFCEEQTVFSYVIYININLQEIKDRYVLSFVEMAINFRLHHSEWLFD